MKKKIILSIALILTITCLCACAEEPEVVEDNVVKSASNRVGEFQLNLSSDWEKVNLNKMQDLTNYAIEYKAGDADIKVEAIYASEVGDLMEVEKTICSEYNDCKDEIVKIDGEEGVKYVMDKETKVHLTTNIALYVLSYTNTPNAPESLDDILKNIKIEEVEG